ncbi:MAG: hypothetical protein ACTIAR_15350, partial [Brachybacterium tyrofermentans]
ADAALTTLAAALILVLAGTAEATTLTLIALLTGVDTAEAALSLLGGPALAVTLALPSALLVLVLAATLALLALAGVRAADTALTTLAAALVLVLAGAAEATALALVALLAGIGTAEAALAPLALALLVLLVLLVLLTLALLALLALLILTAAEAAALLPLVLSAELSGVVLFSHDGTPIVSVGRTPTEQSARDRNVMRGVGRITSAQVGSASHSRRVAPADLANL